MFQFYKSPCFWTGIIAMIAYIDPRALNGNFVYDDAGSVVKNVVVNGMVNWKEAFTRDYWGIEMKEAQSHKSFRPITTLTLKANYMLAQKYQQEDDKHPPTLSFHVINVILHGIVTGLITRATSYILPSSDIISQLIVGFIFGLHPVHAEVVSNITSRGELLMGWFLLIAFLSYAKTREVSIQQYTLHPLSSKRQHWLQRIWGIYILPWICMTLSLFSKEQGATTLISLVLWDFLKHHGSVISLLGKLSFKPSKTPTGNKNKQNSDDHTHKNPIEDRERTEAWQFVIRTIILAIETLVVVIWRYILNGETSPDFIVAQNPAGFAKDRMTRALSVSWVYCLYIRDAIFPYYLCPDWSGVSIDLVSNLKDPRAMAVVALWYISIHSLWTMIVGGRFFNHPRKPSARTATTKISKHNSSVGDWWWNETTLRQINMAIWAFTFSPFLLSSNILVVVGLMKADRVIYLPLFGFCLLEAILISKLLKGIIAMRPGVGNRKELEFWGAYFLLMFQLIIFAGRTHDRNIAWSDSLRLWESAYAVNPKSHHTMYNYGYELSIKQLYSEAEVILRPIGDPRVEGPSNTFVYAMVLFNLKRCNKANVLLEDAFKVIEEKRQEGGPRNTESHLSRTQSNLLVAKAHCTEDMQERGRTLYKAVETDPTNEYAIGLATEFMEKMRKYEELQQQMINN